MINMRKFWTIILGISLFVSAIANNEYCYKGEWVYRYENGVLKDSTLIERLIEKCNRKESSEERVKDKKELMNLKPCK
jgi:hypothetical protein